jgi:hypothetical protein
VAPRVYRNPTTKWVVLGVGVVFVVLAVRAASAVGWTLCVIGIALVLALTMRPRLVVDQHGVTVTNVRSHVLTWQHIAEVTLEGGFWAGGTFLTFHLDDGERVRAWSVGWNYRTGLGKTWTRAVFSDVYGRWVAGTRS